MRYLKTLKLNQLIIIIFFFTNLLFLSNFPFIHSDEAWLSGLSRHIHQEQDLAVTEPFFDLYPRHPHAIKILFHLLQITFMQLLGYNIFTFRLISLLAGTIALNLFYKLAKKFTNSNKMALMFTIILGLDIQYIYASHLARQEIILLLLLLLAFYYFLEHYHYPKKPWQDLSLGLILSTAIGIHPNSFIIALPFILIYTYHLLLTKKIKWSNYLAFGGTLGLGAGFFLILSFRFDPDFLHNYANYGQSLGVFNSLFSKIDQLDYFYLKLFHGISGTYYTPPVKFQFILFALASLVAIGQLIYSKLFSKQAIPEKKQPKIILLLMLLGINLGYVLIGRYNQTSILFIFPLAYLLVLNIISQLPSKYAYLTAALIMAVLASNTSFTLLRDLDYNYDQYLQEIARVVNKDDKVLANLNAEYYFQDGKLFDYRNLAYLEENNLSLAEYITKNQIEYIIYPEEMDFIYNTRPVWNILYGNPYPYYQDMQEFLKHNCQLVHSFTNASYGMRIVRYMGQKEWVIKIYKVK